MNKISFCYILRDAEKTIKKSLESIFPYLKGNEIVFTVDTRTTDSTLDILEDFKANTQIPVKIYEFEWVNDSFADARNFCHSKATGDYIFVIDADERVLKFEPPTDHDFYLVQQYQKENGVYASRFPSLRMFKRGIGIQYEGARHEDIPFEKLAGLKYQMSGTIIENKEKTPEETREKAKGLLERHFQQLKDEPNNQFVKGQIAFAYRTLGDWERALDFAFLSLVFDKDMFYNGKDRLIAPNKAQMANLIGECYLNMDKIDLAKQYFLKSLEFCPDQLWANFSLYDLTKIDFFKKECQRVKDNSKLPFDVLFQNLNI